MSQTLAEARITTFNLPASVLLDKRLSANAIRLYGLLRQDPSLTYVDVAHALGCTPKAAYKLESTLIDAGHLSVGRIRSGGGKAYLTRFFDGLEQAS